MGIRSRIREHLLDTLIDRDPDFIIGGQDNPYLKRWWVIPRNRFFNIYLHLFLRSDDDRALHDHPFLFNCSFLLSGEYLEHVPGDVHARREGSWYFRWGRAIHRIQLHKGACITVFITGPRVREWGFHCPKGWVPWQRFTSSRDKGEVGLGCEG